MDIRQLVAIFCQIDDFCKELHIVTNNKGALLAFKVTKGSRSDSKESAPLLKSLQGLAFGDKGYLGKKLFDEEV